MAQSNKELEKEAFLAAFDKLQDFEVAYKEEKARSSQLHPDFNPKKFNLGGNYVKLN